MASIRDLSLDQTLLDVNDATRLDINFGTIATTYDEATNTKSCGNKTGITIGAPEAGDTSGRKVVVPAIVGGAPGAVTASQTAAFWSLTDGASVFYAAGDLTATLGVTSGNDFTLTAFDIEIQDPTSVA